MSCLIQGDKGQVRRRIHGDNIARADQSFADSRSGGDTGSTQSQVEVILKQGLELDTQEPAFCKQSPVLLHLRDELADRAAVGDHHGLAEKSTALAATDVEDIG